eukprot:5567596-Amphidinium_carterae.1
MPRMSPCKGGFSGRKGRGFLKGVLHMKGFFSTIKIPLTFTVERDFVERGGLSLQKGSVFLKEGLLAKGLSLQILLNKGLHPTIVSSGAFFVALMPRSIRACRSL